MADSPFVRELKTLFPSKDPDDLDGLKRLKDFLAGFENPRPVLKGIARLLKLNDPLVAPASTFLRRRAGPQFEKWDFPVALQTLIETEHGRLLSLPPGSRRFTAYREIIGDIIETQLAARFPRLQAELANRPNLFFPGVFYPQEIEISNLEMISALHGTFYVVHAELLAGRGDGRGEPAAVVLKPTDMALESIATFTLQTLNRLLDPRIRAEIGPILAPTIVAIDDVYGILDIMPGKNGVEFLPREIKTGTIEDLKSNEYPADLDLTREEVLQIAREFAKQAVMAYYLRLYDRKPDQLMIHRGQNGALTFSHIDFGRALKRNYALPWKRHYDPSRHALTFSVHEIPFFEAAGAFIYLPHFIPAKFKSELNPFEGAMRATIVDTFVRLAREVKSNADEIHSLFTYLINRRTQYRAGEVNNVYVEPADVEEVYRSLLTLEDPRDIIESILNLTYHEREGTAAMRVDGDDDQGVYRRALLSADRTTSLADKTDGPFPYRLTDYRRRGRVSYDAEQKTLKVEFGENPAQVIDHIEKHFSRRLARYIRQFPGDPRGAELEIFSTGEVTARVAPISGQVGGKRTLKFPPDIMREINEAGSGFAPAPVVLARVDEFTKSAAAVDFLEHEINKQRAILANDLEGKEILQFIMSVEPDDSPLRSAMDEMIRYLLANPDYLADKDPYESINQLVLSLGRKHLSRLWPSAESMAAEFLPEDFRKAIKAWDRPLLKLYDEVDLSHGVHLTLTARFAEELGRRALLADDEQNLLRIAALLHDLNVLDAHFRHVLMEPSGRTGRTILTAVLERHAEISAQILETRLKADAAFLPPGIDARTLIDVLQNHHGRPAASHDGRRVKQILHLADNIAVFADRTRPDHWNRGFLRLEEIAPRWIDAQLERKLIDREIWEAAQGFFSDAASRAVLRNLDRMSAFYPQCYSALQMAAALHQGLNPQHPNPMADLRDRYGAERVNTIFENLMKSGLSVRDKIKVINRIDSIAPMIRAEQVDRFAFINASAQPVQRVIELILRFVNDGRAVILMGVLPRVIKTYERFCMSYPNLSSEERERVRVIAGERRLQFITHSYPYEAEFRMPFHQIIRTFRETRGMTDPFCLIPFERFMEKYAPARDAAARVRKLEKASDIEELQFSDRVKSEAERYLAWEKTLKSGTIDERAKERFRRIVLNGFTNRDVLLFYDQTVQFDTSFKKAVREVIGALRENPNYLSDRSVYFSIQELVRSLGQIHFYDETSPAEFLRAFLLEQHLKDCAPLAALLNTPRPQFNFVKQSLAGALKIAVEIGREWETRRRGKFSAADWRIITAGTLLTESFLDDPWISDALLSPEDVSANRALRGLLAETRVPLTEMVGRRNDLEKILSEPDRTRLRRIMDGSPLDTEDAPAFLLIQTGLMIGSFCDFSKIENWRRGKVQISSEDLDHLWTFLRNEIEKMRGGPGREALGEFGSLMDSFCKTGGPKAANDLAAPTHSYVRLFNALSLAAELRYGLKARGLDLFHHVQTIYQPEITEPLIEGIMDADFPQREKVKFARKLRILAAALSTETQPPAQVLFLNTDHPLGSAPTEKIQKAGEALIIPAGDFDRAGRILGNLRDRLGASDFSRCISNVKFLVGEDYPLLIKEKSLLRTDDFVARIRAFRARKKLSSRYIFVPANELLDLEKMDRPEHFARSGSQSDPGEKGLFFFRTWMKMFE